MEGFSLRKIYLGILDFFFKDLVSEHHFEGLHIMSINKVINYSHMVKFLKGLNFWTISLKLKFNQNLLVSVFFCLSLKH